MKPTIESIEAQLDECKEMEMNGKRLDHFISLGEVQWLVGRVRELERETACPCCKNGSIGKEPCQECHGKEIGEEPRSVMRYLAGRRLEGFVEISQNEIVMECEDGFITRSDPTLRARILALKARVAELEVAAKFVSDKAIERRDISPGLLFYLCGSGTIQRLREAISEKKA